MSEASEAPDPGLAPREVSEASEAPDPGLAPSEVCLAYAPGTENVDPTPENICSAMSPGLPNTVPGISYPEMSTLQQSCPGVQELRHSPSLKIVRLFLVIVPVGVA